MNAVLATMLDPAASEFVITHVEMIKVGTCTARVRHGYGTVAHVRHGDTRTERKRWRGVGAACVWHAWEKGCAEWVWFGSGGGDENGKRTAARCERNV